MVERIVLLKLKPPFNEPDRRREVAAFSVESLTGLPGVQEAGAGVPADEDTASAWDVRLSVRFRSVGDIPGYIQDPAHRSYVDEYLKPKLACIRAWNFEPVSG